VLIIGTADRVQCGQQVATFLGLVPEEALSAACPGRKKQ
jgi:hypothetical protein